MFDVLVRTFQDWRVARETTRQLNQLSDRELNDIGVRRTDIRSVARGKAPRR